MAKVKPAVLILTGPTASGKTAISLELAYALDGEIISADARQVYRHMDIGTAKPSLEERQNTQHHCLDILDPMETYSAGRFMDDARNAVNDVLSRNKCPIVVGGSGLYIDALVNGLFDEPKRDPSLRRALETRWREEGLGPLVVELRNLDPITLRQIDQSNPIRVLRALEVCLASGKPYSELLLEKSPPAPFRFYQACLWWHRPELYGRIDRRTDDMFVSGFIAEVESLLNRGIPRESPGLRTIGYKQVLEYLDGEMTRERLIAEVRQKTRNYAKRQMTWFRNREGMHGYVVTERSLHRIGRNILEDFHCFQINNEQQKQEIAL